MALKRLCDCCSKTMQQGDEKTIYVTDDKVKLEIRVVVEKDVCIDCIKTCVLEGDVVESLSSVKQVQTKRRHLGVAMQIRNHFQGFIDYLVGTKQVWTFKVSDYTSYLVGILPNEMHNSLSTQASGFLKAQGEEGTTIKRISGGGRGPGNWATYQIVSNERTEALEKRHLAGARG